jgi:large subunit ribosomal protein L13
MIVLDADGAVAGRISALAAKMALKGEEVRVVNAEKAVISGDKKRTISEYEKRRAVHNKGNPEHSPKWPKRPDMLLKKIIIGMLPKHSARGKAAEKRVKTFLGSGPEGLGKPSSEVKLKKSSELRKEFVTLEKVCQALGWQKK